MRFSPKRGCGEQGGGRQDQNPKLRALWCWAGDQRTDSRVRYGGTHQTLPLPAMCLPGRRRQPWRSSFAAKIQLERCPYPAAAAAESAAALAAAALLAMGAVAAAFFPLQQRAGKQIPDPLERACPSHRYNALRAPSRSGRKARRPPRPQTGRGSRSERMGGSVSQTLGKVAEEAT